jgi:hypothetical protein
VHRPHGPAELVAQQLQRGLVLPRRELGAVHQQARRLVDGDEVFVGVQDLQHQGRSPSASNTVGEARRGGMEPAL